MSYKSETLPTGDANNTNNNRTAADRFLATVEWLGNLLPHPITLFALFAVSVVIISGIASWAGLSVIDPRPEGAAGRTADGMIHVVNLLNGEGLRMIVTSLVSNFTGFAPWAPCW